MALIPTHHTDIIPNLDIIAYHNENNVLRGYEIYPLEGYVVRIAILDRYQTDENGNFVLDENGNKILVTPYRIWGGATAVPSYDWTTNPDGFAAELYEEGMIVNGDKPTEPDHETM
jgi:hypothetical protein